MVVELVLEDVELVEVVNDIVVEVEREVLVEIEVLVD